MVPSFSICLGAAVVVATTEDDSSAARFALRAATRRCHLFIFFVRSSADAGGNVVVSGSHKHYESLNRQFFRSSGEQRVASSQQHRSSRLSLF